MMKRFLIIAIAAIFFTSCLKDEIPVDPIERELQFGIADMGRPGYVNQVYYSLISNEQASVVERLNWDLALKNGPDAKLIVLNDAQAMQAWRSPYTDLESASDSSGFGQGKEIEVSATVYTNPVLGNLTGVYLIDLGRSNIGLPRGMYWLEIPSASAIDYKIRFKRYGQNTITEKTIPKEDNSEFVLYSIKDDMITLEPNSDAWDFKFTRFISILDNEGEPLPYSVTGVILNSYNTYAAEFSEKPFEDISPSDTALISLSDAPDVIGFDWKFFTLSDGTSGFFTVDSSRSYIIRNSHGVYYKLRFVGFYGEALEVGVPSFEYQLL